MRNSIWLAWCLIWIWSGCEKTTTTETAGEEKPVVQAPVFNADSAYSYIQRQVDFGPRAPNTPAHDSCASYLVAKLESWADDVQIQEFTGRNSHQGEFYRFQNIIATFNPQATRRILLGAHWDTRMKADKFLENPDTAFDGANDGGSGVGVLLEVARLLAQKPLDIGVDVLFFDAEDQGGLGLDWCLGSKHWTKNKHKPGYSAYFGILVDMVGAKGATFCQEYYTMQYAPLILEKTWEQAHALGFSRYFLYQPSGAIEDDHYYVNVNAGIPMIDIIDIRPGIEELDDYFKHYHHRPADNMEIIDKQTLEAVGTTLITLLHRENLLLLQ